MHKKGQNELNSSSWRKRTQHTSRVAARILCSAKIRSLVRLHSRQQVHVPGGTRLPVVDVKLLLRPLHAAHRDLRLIIFLVSLGCKGGGDKGLARREGSRWEGGKRISLHDFLETEATVGYKGQEEFHFQFLHVGIKTATNLPPTEKTPFLSLSPNHSPSLPFPFFIGEEKNTAR